MKTLRVLITADIHFERLHPEMIDKYTEYFISSLKGSTPDIFVLAGDVTDSRNIKAEASEYKALTRMITSISRCCNELNVKMFVLRGTPSHDGKVMENIIKINKLNIEYFSDPIVYYILGYKVLFLPEVYTDTYESFENMIHETIGDERVDMCIFHGMFDFPIPALRQIDSSFNQSRTVVIDSESFMRKFVKHVSIGGHVHSYMSSNNVVYTGRFVNEIHQPYDKEDFGIKLLLLSDNGYEIHTISNPYLHKYDFVNITINDNTSLDDALSQVKGLEPSNTMVICNILNTHNSRELFKSFVKVFKPVHVKRRMINSTTVDDSKLRSNAGRISLDVLDIDSMLNEIYKTETGKVLNEKIISNIKNFD